MDLTINYGKRILILITEPENNQDRNNNKKRSSQHGEVVHNTMNYFI